jgi:DNA-binding transcriptional LysR family regulator
MHAEDLNWDDVWVFAITAQCHSFRQAAQRLGMSHPTVRRRLGSLEESTGLTLFHRGVDGLHPTLDGQELLEAANDVERAMQALARRARAADAGMRGRVTVTVPPPVARLLACDFTDFAEAWPDIELIVDTSTAFADLGRMEADVAIRVMIGGRSPDEALAGRRATAAHMAIYGHSSATHWIASAPGPDWVTETPFPDLPVRCVMGDASVRLQACRAGVGVAELPCFQGDPHIPRLTAPRQAFEVWVLVHPDLRRNPRLKVFRDAMVDALRRHGPLMRGETCCPPAPG